MTDDPSEDKTKQLATLIFSFDAEARLVCILGSAKQCVVNCPQCKVHPIFESTTKGGLPECRQCGKKFLLPARGAWAKNGP